MGTTIPSLGEYYFKNGKYVLKNKFLRGIKIGMLIGVFIGGTSVTQETSSHMYNQAIEAAGFYQKTTTQKVVDYIKNKNQKIDDADAIQIAKSSLKWSEEFGVDYRLVLAVQEVESTFNKHSISGAGALGVMQVIPSWHLSKLKAAIKDIGTPELFDIHTNIYLGSWVLKDCLSKFKSTSSALLCYNGSNAAPNGYDQKVAQRYNEISKHLKGSV
jgi:soluble lytic murein transglycosylase-like protein